MIATRVVIVAAVALLPWGSAWGAPPAQASAAKEVTNSIGMKLTLIPAGEFQMGARAEALAELQQLGEKNLTRKATDDPEEVAAQRQRFEAHQETLVSMTPQHKVVISKPFYLAVYEVTQREFEQIMGFNPSYYSPKGGGQSELQHQDHGRFAVDRVTWQDAVQFCRQLSELPEEASTGRTYRLPTEAELEYAARAGTTSPFVWGGSARDGEGEFAYKFVGKPHLVGQLKPNPWGFYDMYGVPFEWCADWYGAKTYTGAARQDPTGPDTGVEKIVRGGTFQALISGPTTMRCSWRDRAPPDAVTARRTFRVACDLKPVSVPPLPSAAETASAAKAAAEGKLKSKGLVRSDLVYSLPEEAQFVRYVSSLDRLRAACFSVQNEQKEADRQLSLLKSQKAGALAARIQARTYVSYSDTWREHNNGVRARHNATDAMMMVDLAEDDVRKWQRDCAADYTDAVARFAEQCQKLREMSKTLDAGHRKLAGDYQVTQALAELSGGAKKYRLGPSPAAVSAVKKLENEEAQLAQLKSKR